MTWQVTIVVIVVSAVLLEGVRVTVAAARRRRVRRMLERASATQPPLVDPKPVNGKHRRTKRGWPFSYSRDSRGLHEAEAHPRVP